MTERGTVAFWHPDEGWGAIRCPERPGLGFVHFSFIPGTGYRELFADEQVEFEWAGDYEHDGCRYKAKEVRRLTPKPHSPPS